MAKSRGDPRRTRRGSLVVVGTGITGIGQITMEAVELMRGADRLFYCVIEPLVEMWLKELNPSAVSLAPLYEEGKSRRRTYLDMTQAIVDAVRGGARVCVAFYGHPGVLVHATHASMRKLRRGGYQARMTPGISADACLYAHLGVDPGRVGVQSFEATDFLMYRRRFDPASNLLLWQVGVLGEKRSRAGIMCRPERAKVLVSALAPHYPVSHRVVLYDAPTFPGDAPAVRRVRLRDLPRVPMGAMALLYVPPAKARRQFDRRIAGWLSAD